MWDTTVILSLTDFELAQAVEQYVNYVYFPFSFVGIVNYKKKTKYIGIR